MKDGPGMRWVLVLGAAGFAAGFFGPLIFVPEANQGPLVGIFITGPAGVALGFALYAICSLFKVSARNQWRALFGTAAVGVAATLLGVQPSAALQGTLYEATVTSCSSPREIEPQTIEYWEGRIAEVTWAPARSGWQQDMHTALSDAPGVVVAVQTRRENSVFENRKPWNRGTLFASGWKQTSEEKSFYRPESSCDETPVGSQLSGFVSYDLGGTIEPPNTWPPNEVKQVIDASVFAEVPERFRAFN